MDNFIQYVQFVDLKKGKKVTQSKRMIQKFVRKLKSMKKFKR